MEAQTVINQYHYSKRDERRNVSLVHMEAENRNTRTLQLLQNTISVGKHRITVYADEVEKVMREVEPRPDLIAQAQADYELELADRTAKNIGFGGTAAEMLEVIKAGTSAEATKEYGRLERTGPLSPQGMFHRRNKRAIKPLVSARVIEGSEHPEKQNEEIDRETKRHTTAMADAFREVAKDVIAALKGGPVASEADIDALVEAKVNKLLGGEKTTPSKK